VSGAAERKVQARVPLALRRALRVACAERGMTIQQALREAIEAWLAQRDG
jgi:hypothetical protein